MALVSRKSNKATHLLCLVPGLILVLLFTCRLDGNDVDGYVSPYGTTPTANPDYDNSSAGVYRGILVGSLGIFQIYIANEPDVYEAYLQFDDSNCTLYTEYFNDNPDWEPGDQIVNAVFQGTFPDDGTTWANETVSMVFSVGLTGGNPTINSVTISGHSDPIIVRVCKEGSDRLVLQYVGQAYNDSEDPWADWGFLVICPEGSQDIEVFGCMVDRSNLDDTWEIQTSTAGDGVVGVIYTENSGVTPIQGQTSAVELTALCDGPNLSIPNIKIHGEFDTARWPDRISGWWKSYIDTWGSDHVVIEEGEWDTERTPAPELGGIQISISGQPDSFFDGRTCHYAICQTGGDPNNPAERTAGGTIDLVSGSGASDVAVLANGQYDLYIAVDVDGDGFTFSSTHPFDGDLHDAEMNVSVDGTTNDVLFTLKTVAGEVTWTESLSGDVYVDLCSNVAPNSFQVDQEVSYKGITNATSATYAVDATGLNGGSYYLLGVLTPPGGSIINPLRAGWYGGADAAEGTETPPVNLDSLQDSYGFVLAPVSP